MATMTSQQFRDFETKRLASKFKNGKGFWEDLGHGVETESKLHNQIIDYCREKGLQ